MIISKIIYYICGVNSLSVFLKRTLGYCTGLFLVTNLRRNIYNPKIRKQSQWQSQLQ